MVSRGALHCNRYVFQRLVRECCQRASAPYAEFQYSTLTGSGNTITATRLPVVTATGKIIYVNLTLLFDVDASGTLTLAPAYPQIVPAPAVLVSNFLAGTYVGPDDPNELIAVSGPGVTTGGATDWSLAPAIGGCIYPYSVTWYVGPIISSPLYARITKAGIPTTGSNLFFGIGSANCGNPNWLTNSLIGLAQTGNQLTIESFSNNGVDHNLPVDQRTYPKCRNNDGTRSRIIRKALAWKLMLRARQSLRSITSFNPAITVTVDSSSTSCA
jgi:hypothetical protein